MKPHRRVGSPGAWSGNRVRDLILTSWTFALYCCKQQEPQPQRGFFCAEAALEPPPGSISPAEDVRFQALPGTDKAGGVGGLASVDE